jgi:hypothetical protein
MGLQPNPETFRGAGAAAQAVRRAEADQHPLGGKLAEMMAAKAAIIKDEIGIALADDPEFRPPRRPVQELQGQFAAATSTRRIRRLYAETITYGMFAARFTTTDLNTFSRQEALEDCPRRIPS